MSWFQGKVQEEHKDLGHSEGKSSSFNTVCTGEWGALFFVLPVSQKYLWHLEALQGIVTEKMVLEQIMISSNSKFMGEVSSQQAGAKWRDKNFLQFQIYSIPKYLEQLSARTVGGDWPVHYCRRTIDIRENGLTCCFCLAKNWKKFSLNSSWF